MADASPMLLLRPIENDLRTLADAARRARHGASDVKEAAERGILKIRQLQESYSKALRLQRRIPGPQRQLRRSLPVR